MKRLAAFVALLALLAGGIVAAFWYLVAVDRTHPTDAKTVIVARGSTFDEIAAQLAGAGVIGNALTFRVLARMRHQDVDVRAGEFRFGAHATQDEVLRSLTSGGAQVAAWITIPEGFTAEQIAARLEANAVGSAQQYRDAFLHRSIDVDGAPTKSLEGFLFPSTYLVAIGEDPNQVADLMIEQFFKELPADAAGRARGLHVTVPQAVTVASLVEREAKRDSDRPKIAAVIYNRLRLHMPLQVDATIEYALPEHKAALSFADLRIDSPYNTYVHSGLPPTPIANPGLPSLKAALEPARISDLYYVYCGNGQHVFARTLAEHQANVARCLGH